MVIFDETLHQYKNDDRILISTTQLMTKHGLAPDYSGVSMSVLQAKAERGTLIHKEIEDFIKTKELGFTDEVYLFKNYIEQNEIQVVQSEDMVYNDVIAGTIDLILLKDKQPIIADIKTTSTLHKDSVSWQLSIYLYLFTDATEDLYNSFKGCAYHFNKGKLKVVEIPLKSFSQVNRLVECERLGIIYHEETALVPLEQLTRLAEIEKQIANFETMKKQLESQREELKNNLIIAMEEKGIMSLESDKLKITYIAPQERQTFDSKKLEKEMPEIYSQFLKTTKTKASVRITVREKE